MPRSQNQTILHSLILVQLRSNNKEISNGSHFDDMIDRTMYAQCMQTLCHTLNSAQMKMFSTFKSVWADLKHKSEASELSKLPLTGLVDRGRIKRLFSSVCGSSVYFSSLYSVLFLGWVVSTVLWLIALFSSVTQESFNELPNSKLLRSVVPLFSAVPLFTPGKTTTIHWKPEYNQLRFVSFGFQLNFS